ncbi:MAG: flagellar basal body-associated FliL family protein [Woeseiaceae bacterium]
MAGKQDNAAKKKGGIPKALVAGGGALVLVVLGVFAGPMITSISRTPAETTAAADAPAEAGKSALYTSLHPPLVISFKDSDGDNHYMQMTMDVMARDQKVIDAVKQHTPVIRNALILLYGNVERDAVGTRAGKEKMLADALTEIQNVMTRQTGSAGVEAVYFTSLIVQ